jgi:hypothetical protein
LNWKALLEAESIFWHKMLAMVVALILLFGWITLLAGLWLMIGDWQFPLNRYTPWIVAISLCLTELTLLILLRRALQSKEYSRGQSWFIGMLLVGVLGMILLAMTLTQ